MHCPSAINKIPVLPKTPSFKASRATTEAYNTQYRYWQFLNLNIDDQLFTDRSSRFRIQEFGFDGFCDDSPRLGYPAILARLHSAFELPWDVIYDIISLTVFQWIMAVQMAQISDFLTLYLIPLYWRSMCNRFEYSWVSEKLARVDREIWSSIFA